MATLLVGPGRPYTTIQAAINVVSATNDNPASRAAMDIILVDPGTYTEALDLRASWLLPVIIRGADPANRPIIASTGAAQAVRADSVYRGTAVGELTLDPGSTLFFFTDGVSDVMNPDGEMYGIDRLTDYTRTLGEWPAETMMARIVEETAQYAAGAEAFDEFTMMILKSLAS